MTRVCLLYLVWLEQITRARSLVVCVMNHLRITYSNSLCLRPWDMKTQFGNCFQSPPVIILSPQFWLNKTFSTVTKEKWYIILEILRLRYNVLMLPYSSTRQTNFSIHEDMELLLKKQHKVEPLHQRSSWPHWLRCLQLQIYVYCLLKNNVAY